MKKLRLISLKAFFAIAITFLLGNSVEISSLAQTLDEPTLTADYSGMLLTENQNTENGYVYEINAAGTAVITNYVGTETALIVPDTLGGCKVTEIGTFAFHYCSEITSITLPTGITTIGDYAFNKCNRLTSINIPEGVTRIGILAFNECNSLTDIVLPEGITEIGRHAFAYCYSLTNITIPKGLTKIDMYAFLFCNNLTTVSLPDGLIEIGDNAFRQCSSLKSIKIPNSVNHIGLFAFSDCPGLLGIFGHSGSYVEAYAKEHGYAFIPLGNKSDAFASYQDCFFVLDAAENVHCYNEDCTPVINEFKCDGTYTYYFQADGTAMKNRLTYHPDGIHVIYFDEYGHEVFSDFANVKQTISGDVVDDYCFFDVYGYLYVDVVTYDKTGTYLYYANPYGVMDRGKWFEFSDNAKWADGTPFDKSGGKYGYANADGTLMTNQWTTDWESKDCYMQGNGVALYP